MKGFIAFASVYIVWVPFTLPSCIVTLVGGYIFADSFGAFKGYFLCLLAIWIGHPPAAFFTLMMGRYCFRDYIQRNLITKLRIFEAVDRSINAEGMKMMILLRVQPVIPWNILNYILAVTSC